MFYRRCALCYPAQLKAALNIYALTVLNTNQSAYKPTKLTQRCRLKSHKKHTPANTTQKKYEAAFSQLLSNVKKPLEKRKQALDKN